MKRPAGVSVIAQVGLDIGTCDWLTGLVVDNKSFDGWFDGF